MVFFQTLKALIASIRLAPSLDALRDELVGHFLLCGPELFLLVHVEKLQFLRPTVKSAGGVTTVKIPSSQLNIIT